jgi:hypothetical protein
MLAIRRTHISTAEVIVYGQPFLAQTVSITSSEVGVVSNSHLLGNIGPLRQENLNRIFQIGHRVVMRGLVFLNSFDRVHSVGGNWLVQRLCYLADDADNYFQATPSAKHARLDRQAQSTTGSTYWKARSLTILSEAGLQVYVGEMGVTREAKSRNRGKLPPSIAPAITNPLCQEKTLARL